MQNQKNNVKVIHERMHGRPWRSIRERVLKRADYLCENCAREGRAKPADEVDHVLPLEAGGDNSTRNLQALCVECHRQKTDSESSGAAVSETPSHFERTDRKLTVIVGPPFSGRMEAALNIAHNDTLVLGADAICFLLYGRRWHADLPLEIKREVLRTRNRALSDFLQGSRHRDCVLVTYAGSFKHRKYWEDLGATVAPVLHDVDECVMRAQSELGDSPDLKPIIREIRGWQ